MLKTELLPFQTPAVDKLLPLRVGALFMDMGLGKSRVAIELVTRRREKISKVVWICPFSLKETVAYEIEKHTGEIPYVFDNKTCANNLPSTFWYVVGIESMSSMWGTARSSVTKLIDTKTFTILDESSFIKGHKSERAMSITYMCACAQYRLILNGTPISQGVVDLYSQYRFLSPKILGYKSFYSFAANHLEYSERFPGMIVRSLRTDVLAAKVAPYTYQVRKEDCIDLPKKLYETRYFTMTPEQEAHYHQAKHELLESLEPDDMTSVTIFKLFTALQQIVCGFWSRREPSEDTRFVNPLDRLTFPQERTQALLDVLTQIPSDERVIIWAKFGFDIQAIQSALTGIYGDGSVSLFYGENQHTRNDELEVWRSARARFLVATPGSGGHGLTLNEASWVVFYSNSFKYSERAQAEDRCHRIGQQRSVTYIDLVCRGSIDQRIQRSISGKSDVVKSFRAEIARVKDLASLKAIVEGL